MQAQTNLENTPRRWTLGRILARVPIIFIDEYSLLLLLFLLAKWLFGERWEVIGLGNSFALVLLLPTPVLLAIALLRRRWSMVAILLPAVLFVLISYGPFFLPRSTQAAVPGSKMLSILTYNIHSEVQVIDPIVAVMREANADVIALQELSSEASARFAVDLADLYPYQALHPQVGEPVIGQGILSKYPIRADVYWRNENLSDKLGHQRVELDDNGIRLILYNAHPIHPILKNGHLFDASLRTQEIDSVLERASRDSGAVIIVGDFNMSDQADDYRRITARYADSYREIGWGFGFTFPDFSHPNAVPGPFRSVPLPLLVRLDYIFHNSAVHPLEITVWPSSGGSDHRPVFARLALDANLPSE